MDRGLLIAGTGRAAAGRGLICGAGHDERRAFWVYSLIEARLDVQNNRESSVFI